MRKLIKEYLDDMTAQIGKESIYEEHTTSYIAKKLGLGRSTVSSYLNELVETGEVFKVKAHPVIFFSISTFSKQFFTPAVSIYDSIQDLWREKEVTGAFFNEVIGYNGSLSEQIGQIKTAAQYPKGGLALMLLGPSGSGKTFLAEHIYNYSKQERIIGMNAPFVSLNCAQYYNNPELLSSILFGYKKGAFTGADADKAGLLEQANQGVLFLDEVHRLSIEGQEKLFTFMDSGTFSPIGDASTIKKSDVRLVFATTESVQSTFLPTFMRRIPVIVTIPSFAERPNHERLELIDCFFRKESEILEKKLSVSSKIIHFIMDYKNEGNVGKVRNIIKYSCARSFSRNKRKDWMNVTVNDLPAESKQELNMSNLVHYTKYQDRFYDYQRSDGKRSINSQQQKISDTYLQVYRDFSTFFIDAHNEDQYIRQTTTTTNLLMEDLIFNFEVHASQSVFHLLSSSLRALFHELEDTIETQINSSVILTLAHLLFYKDEAKFMVIGLSEQLIEAALQQFIKLKLKESYWIANQIADHLRSTLEMTIYLEDIIFMTFYLNSMNIQSVSNRPECLIVAHGYSTASSMANFANRLLDKNIFKAIDMPFETAVDEVKIRIRKYINQLNVGNGLILLVDMGSLVELKTSLLSYVKAPILLIDFVSTPIALEIGHLIKQGQTLYTINEMLDTSKYQSTKNLVYPQNNKQKALITCCYTGMGSAIQIQDILEKTFKNDISAIKIIPYDYHKLLKNKENELPLQLYDVLAIVGTANPEVANIPYIGLENLISGERIDSFIKLLHQHVSFDEETFKNELIFNFSIQKVMENVTILDAEKSLSMTKNALDLIEKRMNIQLDNNRRFLFYLHAASMIERVLRKEYVDDQEDIEEYKRREKEKLEIISQAFTVIEREYMISISDLELRLLNDILIAN